MTRYFLDTSAVAKNYTVEIGTDVVESILGESDARFTISELTTVEIRSTLAWKVRTGAFSQDQMDGSLERFRDDASTIPLNMIYVNQSHFGTAVDLIERIGPTRALHTLDALQLAVALDLLSRGWLDHVVCADRKLVSIMRDEGLSVINPEEP